MTKRPMPPEFVEVNGNDPQVYQFAPAPEIYDWLHQTILNKDHALYNEEHDHLIEHTGLAFLWAEGSFEKRGRVVLGQCELVSFKVSGWQKYRQESQMTQWFGQVPKALITLAADYCRNCSDAEFCALVEHEMYHLAQRQGMYGPCFDQDGNASLVMRSHDVEEFYGVVRRYGATGDVQRMVDIVNEGAEVSRANIAHACGTCMLRFA